MIYLSYICQVRGNNISFDTDSNAVGVERRGGMDLVSFVFSNAAYRLTPESLSRASFINSVMKSAIHFFSILLNAYCQKAVQCGSVTTNYQRISSPSHYQDSSMTSGS